MCGIAGFLQISSIDNDALSRINCMANAILHRGPDDQGIWIDDEDGVALGHRRLSIIDLSKNGHQPMLSASGRYIIVYNGEFYNYSELKRELSYQNYKGTSDTEVLLAAIEQFGCIEAVKKLEGMFAFAVWDKIEKCLFLARDRIGEKPLYYYKSNDLFIFASELKAIKAHPRFEQKINVNALNQFFRYSYIPSPLTIYQNVYKLPAGSIAKIKLNSSQQITCEDQVKYWSLYDIVNNANNSYNGTFNDAVAELDTLLKSTVKKQMISDVPLGTFLSGGVDSSLITAIMSTQTDKKVKTFTIGFNSGIYNEANYAKEIAGKIGTDHTELYVTESDVIDIIPKLPLIYDEPFADSSQLPTYLLSKLTKEYVTVCLSGDGGDEVFGGYNRYYMFESIWNVKEKLPKHIKKLLECLLDFMPQAIWQKLIPKRLFALPGEKIDKIIRILKSRDRIDAYHQLISTWDSDKSIIPGITNADSIISDDLYLNNKNFSEQMMLCDTLTYLPDDILVKVDRAAMASSLETRIPYINHKVIEFAWRLPFNYKIERRQGKIILRELLKKYIPTAKNDRIKTGFAVPIDLWLRGSLKMWADELINSSQDYIDKKIIRQLWAEHCSGKKNHHHKLWNYLMFQAWHNEHIGTIS